MNGLSDAGDELGNRAVRYAAAQVLRRAEGDPGVSEEKPDSFLVRAFKKAFFIGTAAATLAFGSTFIIGKWEQQALTQLLGKDSYTLDVDSPPQTGGKGMPLFIGSADIGRVMMMQENLLTLGLPLGPCGADGLMKAEDLRAVNRFRAALGLPPAISSMRERCGRLPVSPPGGAPCRARLKPRLKQCR